MNTNQITGEERQQLAENRRQIRNNNAQRFAGLRDLISQERKEAIELMRRRHAYYTTLINEAGIKTAQEFYDKFKELFLMYGIKLKLSDDKTNCSIYLELGDYDYDQYWIEDGTNDGFAVVSPEVAFKNIFANLEINIFKGEYL